MILDTNVLIKLEREARKGMAGIGTQFVASLGETRFCITPTIAGEFASGISMSRRDVWESALFPYETLPITSEVAWQYGKIYRHLSSKGQLIGTNDLWIAAAGLAHQLPLATGNVKEFSRVPHLDVIPLQ